MNINKNVMIDKICYTELVYGRINKKLGTKFTKDQIGKYIKEVLLKTGENDYSKIGKNYYIVNTEYQIRITINPNTHRVITVDKLKKFVR